MCGSVGVAAGVSAGSAGVPAVLSAGVSAGGRFFDNRCCDPLSYLSHSFFGGSSSVISWMNLKSNCTGVMKREVDNMRRTMHYTWSHMNFGGTAISEDMFQWIPTHFNTIADELADKVPCWQQNH